MPKILKLGRLPKRHDRRTLKLSNYLKATDPIQFPPFYRWGAGIQDWRMLANDSLGNCTIASALHMMMLWRKEHGVDYLPLDSDAIALYREFAGYDPSRPETDGGAVELDILKSWRNTGIAGQKISAFVDVDVSNIDHMRAAVWLFGAVYVGVTLSQTAMDEFAAKHRWSVTRPWKCKSKIVGGHAVPIVGYDEEEFFSVSWGRLQRLTVPWWKTYGDEAWAVISPDWLDSNRKAPNGFDIESLVRDLATIDGPILE